MAKPDRPRLMPALLILCAAPLSALALSTDRDEPIHIQADSAEIDELKGTSVYRGNVRVDQGTMKITGDEVEIIAHDDEVVEIIAKSASTRLAHYQQQPEVDQELVYADAREITLFVREDRIRLVGDASLKHTTDHLQGETLQYDARNRRVLLTGNSDEGGQGRISIYMTPKTKEE